MPAPRRIPRCTTMKDMAIPDWRTSSAGAKVRVALWLHTEVGAGGTFTKQQLRDAFPNIEQIDRRMRDLRTEDWVIATYREDRALAVDELRLVKEGGPVWEPTYRSRQQGAVTDKQRQAVFAADNYLCLYCGVSGGEAYPDQPLRTAKLTAARVTPPRGGPAELATCCDRCHAGEPAGGTAADLLEQAESLSPDGRKHLKRWVSRGSRDRMAELELWAQYRRLPAAEREVFASGLRP